MTTNSRDLPNSRRQIRWILEIRCHIGARSSQQHRRGRPPNIRQRNKFAQSAALPPSPTGTGRGEGRGKPPALAARWLSCCCQRSRNLVYYTSSIALTRQRSSGEKQNGCILRRCQNRGRRAGGALRPQPGHLRERRLKIDALVYELYGLTEEEIGVVEGLNH
jgi:hypothetical protein